MFTMPKTDSGLLSWSATLLAGITPSPVTFGLTSTTVAAYQAVHDIYASALAACDPAIRTRGATAAKDTARDNLKTQAKYIVSTIYGVPTVTDAQKVELGIPPRSQPTPIPAPSMAPIVGIVGTMGRTVHLTLKSPDSNHRGRPPGVQGIAVFSHVGPTPPTSSMDWHFEANTNKVSFAVQLADSVPSGSTVYFTAMYFNPRLESGPSAVPVSVNLPGGGALPQASVMSLAA